MTGIYRIERKGQEPQILIVEGIRDERHASMVIDDIADHHLGAEGTVEVLALHEDPRRYTATEVHEERNLLGRIRRYSTPNGTVTIPQD